MDFIPLLQGPGNLGDVDFATWWDDAFHVYYASGAGAAFSGDASVCCVRCPGEAADPGAESGRRYITGLCSVPSDMQVLSHALRLRNALCSLAGTPRAPALHKALLPEGTQVLSAQPATPATPQPDDPCTAHWAAQPVREVEDFLAISSLGGAAQAVVYPNRDVYAATYLAPVVDAVAAPRHTTPATRGREVLAAIIRNPDQPFSPASLGVADAPAEGRGYVLCTELRCASDALSGADPTWRYPVSRALGLDTAGSDPSASLLPAPTYAGQPGYAKYPTLLRGNAFATSPNVFTLLEAEVRAGGAGAPAPALPLCVYDRRAAAVFRLPAPEEGRGLPGGVGGAAAASWRALVLHDMSSITAERLGGGGEEEEEKEGWWCGGSGLGDLVFRHNGRPLLVDRKLVRLAEPSAVTGVAQYMLHDVVQYARAAQLCVPALLPAGQARALCSSPASPVPAVGVPDAAAQRRCVTVDGIGEATLLGPRFSLRFEDRCLLRWDTQHASCAATLLLPSGEQAEVRMDSAAFPRNVHAYCVAALDVMRQLRLKQ